MHRERDSSARSVPRNDEVFTFPANSEAALCKAFQVFAFGNILFCKCSIDLRTCPPEGGRYTRTPMENRELARILRETAQLLEIDGAMIGRFRSYEKAAELIASLPERIEDLAADAKKLTELPGIGEGLAEHIREILKTGDYKLRQKLLKKYPHTLLDVLTLQSLGPKNVAV